MTQKNYNCTQLEVYSAALLAWQSCAQHQADFVSFSPMYTPAFIATKRQEAIDASQLPDAQARGAQSEVFRVELEQLAKTCLGDVQKLKRYISKAWPQPLQKARLEEAGFDYYEKAGNNDWEACKGLLSSGANFIDEHSATLLANLNMSPDFEAEFLADKAAFFAKHEEFLNSEENGPIGTETKQVATNAVYAACIAMCLDGQEIFRNNDAIRKQFVFEEILFLVSGTGTAGFKGTVTDNVSRLPVNGVVFTLKGSEKTTSSDENGKFSIFQLAAGEWEVTASKPGYADKKFTQEVKVGTVSNITVLLQPAEG